MSSVEERRVRDYTWLQERRDKVLACIFNEGEKKTTTSFTGSIHLQVLTGTELRMALRYFCDVVKEEIKRESSSFGISLKVFPEGEGVKFLDACFFNIHELCGVLARAIDRRLVLEWSLKCDGDPQESKLRPILNTMEPVPRFKLDQSRSATCKSSAVADFVSKSTDLKELELVCCDQSFGNAWKYIQNHPTIENVTLVLLKNCYRQQEPALDQVLET